MSADKQLRLQEGKETARLEAFSDGVFGIAMTLLVLEIKVPHAADLSGKAGCSRRSGTSGRPTSRMC